MRAMWLVVILLFGCVKAPEREAEPIPGRSTVGNGSDYFPAEHGSAWFLGSRKIRWCREGFDDEGAIAWAFERWRRYLVKKELNDARYHPERVRQPGDPVLAMSHEPMERCDGSEDLKFYLGVEDERVKRYLPYYVNPIGFAERESYDPATGWGKGLVWVGRREGLRPVLVHELGHVAGCGHVTDTVMDADLAGLIAGDRVSKLFNSSSIDWWGKSYRELLLCETCGYEQPFLGVLDPRLFERLSGIKGISGTVQLEEKADRTNEIVFSLHSPRRYGARFTLGGITKVAELEGEGPVFRQIFLRDGKLAVLSSRTKGVVYSGHVKTAQGELLPFLIKRNVAGSTYTIDHLTESGETLRLFRLYHVLKRHGMAD